MHPPRDASGIVRLPCRWVCGPCRGTALCRPGTVSSLGLGTGLGAACAGTSVTTQARACLFSFPRGHEWRRHVEPSGPGCPLLLRGWAECPCVFWRSSSCRFSPEAISRAQGVVLLAMAGQTYFCLRPHLGSEIGELPLLLFLTAPTFYRVSLCPVCFPSGGRQQGARSCPVQLCWEMWWFWELVPLPTQSLSVEQPGGGSPCSRGPLHTGRGRLGTECVEDAPDPVRHAACLSRAHQNGCQDHTVQETLGGWMGSWVGGRRSASQAPLLHSSVWPVWPHFCAHQNLHAARAQLGPASWFPQNLESKVPAGRCHHGNARWGLSPLNKDVSVHNKTFWTRLWPGNCPSHHRPAASPSAFRSGGFTMHHCYHRLSNL